MADTHETIDGLLAEFRGYLAGMPPSYHFTVSWADFRLMLDRFEAAHRRERGDAAKLREALKELVANIEMRSSTFGLNVMVDTKTYLDAKAALAATEKEGGANG